jgi:hypothetical protein
MVARGRIRGDGCRRDLAQQRYEFDVEFRFNGPKVQQDGVFTDATDHWRIQPSQRPQQGLRLECSVTKRYGCALQASGRCGPTTDQAEDRNRFCEKIARAYLGGNPFAPPENF